MGILIFVPDISFIRSLYISTGLLPRGGVSGYRDKFCCLHKQLIIITECIQITELSCFRVPTVLRTMPFFHQSFVLKISIGG